MEYQDRIYGTTEINEPVILDLIKSTKNRRQGGVKIVKKKIHTIKIYCAKCKALLYKYHKEGQGHLVKCYKDKILEDHTRKDLKCPKCNEVFARETIIHNRPANKIIQGKVYVRR